MEGSTAQSAGRREEQKALHASEVFTLSHQEQQSLSPSKNSEVNPKELGKVWKSANKSLSNDFKDNVINGVFKLLDQIQLIKLEYIWRLYLPEQEE